ncbi:MAG: hypothetical protein ACEPOW_06130 [Bacteroidales bacterium]
MDIKLLQFEKEVVLKLNSASMICFFEGKGSDIYKRIRERMIDLLRLNPWMASKVVKEKREVFLRFDELKAPEKIVDKILIQDYNLVIDQTMEYTEMDNATKKHQVVKGKKLIKTGGYVTKVTILNHKIDNTSGIAVLFSMAHVAADGHTYYKLLNSLYEPSQMQAMKFQRNMEADNLFWHIIGKKKSNYLPFRIILKIIQNLYFGKKVRYFCRFLNENKINKIKEDYASKAQKKFPYISTNDVVTSTFCKATNSDVTFLIINLRDKIEGVNELNAGNYQFALLLNKKHFQTPESVRQMLSQKDDIVFEKDELLNLFQVMKSNLTMITNVTNFVKDYHLFGLKQVLHIPVRHPQDIFCDLAFVYKARNNRKAVLYFGKVTPPENYIESGHFEESVSGSLFS